jgi:hypothetical protein
MATRRPSWAAIFKQIVGQVTRYVGCGEAVVIWRDSSGGHVQVYHYDTRQLQQQHADQHARVDLTWCPQMPCQGTLSSVRHGQKVDHDATA